MELLRSVQHVTVARLIELADDDSTSPAVLWRVEEALRKLRGRLDATAQTGKTLRAHARYLLATIDRYLDRPLDSTPPPTGPPDPPPGSPIGSGRTPDLGRCSFGAGVGALAPQSMPNRE